MKETDHFYVMCFVGVSVPMWKRPEKKMRQHESFSIKTSISSFLVGARRNPCNLSSSMTTAKKASLIDIEIMNRRYRRYCDWIICAASVSFLGADISKLDYMPSEPWVGQWRQQHCAAHEMKITDITIYWHTDTVRKLRRDRPESAASVLKNIQKNYLLKQS